MKITPKIYTTRGEKAVDFAIGFGVWLLGNAVMYACVGALLNQGLSDDNVIVALLALPLLINIGAIVTGLFTRRWMALGALAAFATLLVGAVILGIFVYAICFTAAR